jgi:hypothetical protein
LCVNAEVVEVSLVVSGRNLLAFVVARELGESNECIALDLDRSDGTKDIANGLIVVAVDDRQLIAILSESDSVHEQYLSNPLTPGLVVDHDRSLGGNDCLAVLDDSELSLDNRRWIVLCDRLCNLLATDCVYFGKCH